MLNCVQQALFYWDVLKHYFVCGREYINDKSDSKKELSNYLSTGVFNVFVDKACSYLWNDIGKFLFIPRTEQQVLDQGRIVNNFYDIMFEYPYIFEGRSVAYRNNDIRDLEIQRKR